MIVPALFIASAPPSPNLVVSVVSQARLLSTVRQLSTAYPTRNTSSPHLTEAAEWVANELRKVPGLEVEIMRYEVQPGPRVPAGKTVVQVLATIVGETKRRVMMGGHLDTIHLGQDPLTAIAPGANDDGSGVAATMECARVLAARYAGTKPRNTLTFVAFSGEEQGLFGSTALARRAKNEGWPIDAVLSNDTIGGGKGADGRSDLRTVRLYSEEGETHPSRELARFIEWRTRGVVRGFGARLVFRRDRFQRGGDHTPFNRLDFPAVRLVESIEDFSRQHTERDTMEGITPAYLTNVCRLNAIALASLADADLAPIEVKYDLKQSYDTILRWKAKPNVRYVVYWRETASAIWQGSLAVGEASEAKIARVNKDDHTFAVGAEGGIPVAAEVIR